METYLILMVLLMVFFIFYFLFLMRKPFLNEKQVYKVLLLFISLYVTFMFPFILDRFYYNNLYFSSDNIYPEILNRIFDAIQISLIVIIIFYISFNKYISKSNNTYDVNKHIADFIKQLFQNEKFYTAFSISLPKGDKDKEFGLDYIPFMLQNIEDKRKRFKIYADRFLVTTLILGIFFIAIVIFFGYILINDNSIGISKNVSELRIELGIANSNLSQILNEDVEKRLALEYSLYIEKTKNDLSIEEYKNKPGINYLISSLMKFQREKDFDSLFSASKVTLDSLKKLMIIQMQYH